MIPQRTIADPAAPIPPEAVRALSRIAAAEGGLNIGEDKADFLVARLALQLSRLGLTDYASYAAHLGRAEHGEDRRRFIEALTTHTTSFFRETPQFDWLRETGLPDMMRAGIGRRRPIEIWSAACSSGQELFSALMLVAALPGMEDTDIPCRGVGTDLSGAILARCERAIYGRDEIAGIPLPLRRRFLLSSREDPDRFRIVPELRRQARWVRANLTRAGDLVGVRADIAFLRNVLIYFDAPTRQTVLGNVIARINPGGYLLTGHSETIDARAFGLTSVRPSIYRKKG